MREAFTVGIVLAAKDMYSGVMAKAQRNLGILQKTSKNAASAFEKSLKRYQGILAAGATISIVSGQLSGKIQEMTQDAVEFSAAMGKAGTVVLDNLGKFKSHQAAMEAWRTKGLDVSTRSLFNATELINDASYNLMSSGLAADEAMDMLESVSNTAIATVGSLNTTAGLFGSIMNTFGQRWDMSSLEKGTRIMNVLSGAVKEFMWTGDVLAEGLSYAVSTATTMNVRFEDTVAILGMLNSQGVKGTKAGTALNMGFIQLVKNAKRFGISIEDVNGDLLPMPEILEKINNKLKGMGAVKKAAEIEKYFGVEGGKVIQMLMENSEQLDVYIKVLQESAIAARMVKERMGTLSAEVKTQEHRWQNLRIELGEKAAPMMLIFKKSVLELVDVLGEVPHAKAFAGITVGIVGMAAEAGKVVGPAMTMVGVLGMWHVQAKLAAAAQAQLNLQMGKGSIAAGTQATRMGMMGSKGGALVGVLGKVSLLGTAAFVGWGIGTAIRQIEGLDEAVQNLFLFLKTGKTFEELDFELEHTNRLLEKLKKGFALTEEEKKFIILFEYKHLTEAGYKPTEIKGILTRKGLGGEEIDEILKTEKGKFSAGMRKKLMFGPLAGIFQTGVARVPKTGLALVHAGEEITPKSMAGGKSMIVNNYFGDIVLPQQPAGSSPTDARQFARSLMSEINRMMKFEARRLP